MDKMKKIQFNEFKICKKMNILKRGETFGEEAIRHSVKRTASA